MPLKGSKREDFLWSRPPFTMNNIINVWVSNQKTTSPFHSLSLKPCSQVTSGCAFASNFKNGFYGNKWGCSHSIYAFDGNDQRKTQSQALSVNASYYFNKQAILTVLQYSGDGAVTLDLFFLLSNSNLNISTSHTHISKGLDVIIKKV